MNSYNKSISSVIELFLNEKGFHFNFNKAAGRFTFKARLPGKIEVIEHNIKVYENEALFHATSPSLKSDPSAPYFPALCEFFHRLNWGSKAGGFELDFDSGEIRYKVFLDCKGIVPTIDMIRDSIFTPAARITQYGPAILSIIYDGISAQQGIEQGGAEALSMLKYVLGK